MCDLTTFESSLDAGKLMAHRRSRLTYECADGRYIILSASLLTFTFLFSKVLAAGVLLQRTTLSLGADQSFPHMKYKLADGPFTSSPAHSKKIRSY